MSNIMDFDWLFSVEVEG